MEESNKIFYLYGEQSPKIITVHNSSPGDNDYRMIYIIELANKDKLAVKVNKNSFTTPERVKGWAELTRHYNKLGIYCPKIVPNINGEYCAEVNGYLVFAEEYMKHRPVSEMDEYCISDKKYERKLFESIGLVASNPIQPLPWYTAYCIYDKFDTAEKYDENYECAISLCNYYSNSIPELASRAEKIFKEYNRRRVKFEPVYRLLPKSVFQGDINDTNILIDSNGDFKGLIDFNLSGTETILNYTFCESYYSINASEIEQLLDTEAMKKRDAWTAQRMAWIGRYYNFTDDEKKAMNEYYNIVAPFRWPNYCLFMSVLKDREKYPEGKKYARDILDWIEYQMTRKDAGKLLPIS